MLFWHLHLPGDWRNIQMPRDPPGGAEKGHREKNVFELGIKVTVHPWKERLREQNGSQSLL